MKGHGESSRHLRVRKWAESTSFTVQPGTWGQARDGACGKRQDEALSGARQQAPEQHCGNALHLSDWDWKSVVKPSWGVQCSLQACAVTWATETRASAGPVANTSSKLRQAPTSRQPPSTLTRRGQRVLQLLL